MGGHIFACYLSDVNGAPTDRQLVLKHDCLQSARFRHRSSKWLLRFGKPSTSIPASLPLAKPHRNDFYIPQHGYTIQANILRLTSLSVNIFASCRTMALKVPSMAGKKGG